jgi:hypothetical protein
MSEMLHQCNVTQRGIKIVTNWPDCATGDHPVRVGDLVEVEGRRYVVRGVKERPACYLDIYVQEM